MRTLGRLPQLPLLLLVLVATVALLSVTAHAKDPNSWGCENYWSGASKDNSVKDCIENQDRKSQWQKWFWIPALPLLVLAIVLGLYPFVFICRQCCNLCGGRRRQPGVCCRCASEWDDKTEAQKDSAYEPGDHMCVKCPAFAICILSVGVIVTLVRGASEADKANDYLKEDIKSHPIDVLSSLKTQIQTAVTNTTTSAYLSPITTDSFSVMDDMVGYFQDGLTTYENDYEKYVTNGIRIGMNCLGALPFVFFILLPLYASRNNCRRFWPCCTTCVYFLFAVVFSLLGILFLFIAVALATGCGEVERQTLRMPGVFQWYVKPFCTDEGYFGTFVSQFSTNEVTRAQDFCLALTGNCSSSTTYSSSSPDDNFVCSFDSSNYASVCTSWYAASVALSSITSKTGSPACSGSCKFSACPTSCTTSALQTSASQTLNYLTASKQFSSGYNISLPLNDCDYILDLGANAVSRGCPALRNSSWMIGFGCFFASILFSVGIIVLFRGQKVFYKLIDANKAISGSPHSARKGNDREMNEVHSPSRV